MANPHSSRPRQARRHHPLGEDYSPLAPLKQKAGKKRKAPDGESERREGYVDSKSSRRILDIGQDLTAEDEAERNAQRPAAPPLSTAFTFDSRFPDDDLSEDEGAEDEGEAPQDDDEAAWGDGGDEVEEMEIDPQDLHAFNSFHPSFDPVALLQPEPAQRDGTSTSTTLADLILDKIAAHEALRPQPDARDFSAPSVVGGGQPEDAVELPVKVVEVYTQVGTLLSRYKSGKLPKPFKILPTLPQCAVLLSITRPETWTPNALYEATKLFTSSRPALAQAFCSDILLPCVRDDIHETRKLNVHLYKALKKSLYKPAAFFRGLLLPLAASGTCTLREATIVASVIARVSIPVLHSATALYRLCEIAAEQMMQDVESAGACNIFIRTLLVKKYALPYRVVDALVFHFLRFRAMQAGQDVNNACRETSTSKTGAGDLSNKLPVLWHQCLLAFAQRYKNEITEDQREALLDLLLGRGHKQIGPEVRRELLEGRGRGTVVEESERTGGDDTMLLV